MTKTSRKISISILIFLIGIIYLIFTLEAVNSQKVAFGIKVADFNLGNQTLRVSQEILKDRWDTYANSEIALTYQDQTWQIKLADLGFQINYQTTANQAYQITRQSNDLINLKDQLAALVGFYNLTPIYVIDEQRFESRTAEIFKDIERLAKDATLTFNQETDQFILQPSNKGSAISREKLLNDLSGRIKSFSNQSISLSLVNDFPEVEDGEIGIALEKANQILESHPFRLDFEERHWTVKKEVLVDWIKFEATEQENSDNQILGLSLDRVKMREHLKNYVASTIDRPTTNARLKIEGSQATLFIPEQNGFEVKMDRTLDQLTENILSNPSIQKTEITASRSRPKIKLWQTNNLGINTLIASGVSNFAGSPNNRIHNIKTGSAKLNGVILNPSQEFSFNTLIGDSGPEQGYLPELVIKKGKLVSEYGGGLCQVSTTFFRAAINSGSKIIERYAHAFPVVYYKPHGFDATVYDPRPDLRFINNTSAHLLLQTIIEGNQLTVNVYGTDDGRRVKIEGPYIISSRPNGSMKTVLTQRVYLEDEIIEEQVFYSNYSSPNLYTNDSE